MSGSNGDSGSVIKRLIHLRLYLDRSSLEVFVNDGEVVMSTRMYPRSRGEKRHVKLFSKKGELEKIILKQWELDDIWE
ncbi:GH32 C-terminal domain-containing protein [Bacillus coahuilensis]|uniref:GH32 C-terminal domain-containing protein n=1 Tax=Bacillus coahuilensis TaxID=408580 RepID=UPI0023B9DEE1|nr:GH32 C-terminal domain-containing protein [Bacillus coahuilensis]